MSDAQPLPARPDLDQYKKLAKDLQRAGTATDADAFRHCAVRWLEALAHARQVELTAEIRARIEREAHRMEQRWQKLLGRGRSRTRTARSAPGGAPETRPIRVTDAQLFVAREHEFASWPKFAAHIAQLMRPGSPVANFEAAVDAIVAGDIAVLASLLRVHPDLVRARSTRQHRSTLLHYVSANGVEDYRQKTPPNIVEITRLLLDAGADVNATSDAYGGGSTTLGLAGTSVHPEQAGVQMELLELLLKRGASLEQPGYPLVKACLANGQGPAARLLASRGAALDFEDAAGVGRLDLVKGYFDENGRLRNGATQNQLESGFLYACGYGRTEVAEFLLAKGVDPNVMNSQGQTPLHWVAYGPHVAVAKLLLHHGADVNVKDGNGRTPLQWALGNLSSEGTEEEARRAHELVALLRAAGASA
jgi:ankyrin repeat protein